MVLPRSPEAKKRKAPIQNETTNGPSAKKAKPSAESSSSEESSSDDEKEVGKAPKSTPAGSVIICGKQLSVFVDRHSKIHIELFVAKAASAKVTPSAASNKTDSRGSKDQKQPAKTSVKVSNKPSSTHTCFCVLVLLMFDYNKGVFALRLL